MNPDTSKSDVVLSLARINVTVRLSKPGIEKVDELRGVWSRSEYIRNATADAVKAGKRGPKVADL